MPLLCAVGKTMNIAQKKVVAEQMYMDGSTAKAIAITVLVSENTVGKWIKAHGWKEARDYLKNAPHRIERKLLEELENLADGGQANIDADAVSKIKSALTVLQKEVNPPIVYSVLKKLDTFTATSYPEKSGENTELHRAFLHYIIEAHG